MQKYLDEYIKTDLTITEIAHKNNINIKEFTNYIRSNGYIVYRNATKNIILNLKNAIDYYITNDVSVAKTAIKFGISASTLSKHLKLLGINVVNKQNQLTINEHIFDEIDTEEKAYWLGFLYADGCIYKSYNKVKNIYRYRLTISLKERDYDHLVKFNNFIESSNNKVKIKKTNYKQSYCYRWEVNNKHLFDTLNLYGCTERKSLTLKFPDENVFKSKDLIRHFIRGYFDGDGTISFCRRLNNIFKPKVSLLGTYNMLQKIVTIVGLNTKLKVTNNNYTYYISLSIKDSFKLMYYMYEDSNIYLNRKYERYSNFLNNAVTESNLCNY